MESERPDAIFRDPWARRLAGPKGEAIAHNVKHGLRMAWPMIVRTASMDGVILRAIADRGVDAVLNLAAGLDTRPWRLDLPATLQWTDVDHAVMLDLKTTEMAAERPRCRYQAVSMDLADEAARRELFRRVGGSARRVLVITEGLLIYLTSEAVTGLATDLHAESTFACWLTDLASPDLLRWMEKSWGGAVRAGNAPFRFAPAEGTAFFTPLGWREAEWHSMLDDGIRLNRTFPLARVWRFLGRFGSAQRREKMRRFSGITLLQRTG